MLNNMKIVLRNRMEKIQLKHHKKWIYIIAIIMLICIVALIIDENGFWVDDYKIAININGKVLIDDYRGDESMVIPSKIGPFKVEHVNFGIFRENENISSLYIPSDFDAEVLIGIEECVNLKRIEFEKGTTVLSIQVFDCDNLEEVIIPEGVIELNGCFRRCASLEDIKFPSTLKRAKKRDFENSNIYDLHKNEKYYVVGDGVLLFYNGDYNQEIVIPIGIKCFDDYIPKDEIIPRNVYIPDTISILRTQVSDVDIFYFGDGEIENLDLNCLSEGIKGTIVAPANSYVEQYCKENGYNFRVMTDEEEKEWREKTEAAASEITYQEN